MTAEFSACVAWDVDLSELNTMGLSCNAQAMWRLRDPKHRGVWVNSLRESPKLNELPWRVLGGGSNLILPPQLDALVIKNELQGYEVLRSEGNSVWVRVGGGVEWHEFVMWTLAQGWSGVENLALIPGTVGAAPVQNIGAYGVEVSESIDCVEGVCLSDGVPFVLNAQDCEFAYRNSVFKQELKGKVLIENVVFRLSTEFEPRLDYKPLADALRKIDAPTPSQVAEAVIAIRQSKLPDPAKIGNSGSFFQNPLVSNIIAQRLKAAHPALPIYPQVDGRVKLAAGWLIEYCGWKGRFDGVVGMYQHQALCLVHRGGGDLSDVVGVSSAVQADVQSTFGVRLEPEPVFWN